MSSRKGLGLRRAHVAIVAILSGALLLNVVEFPLIEQGRNSRWQAINSSATDDLLVLAMSQSPNLRGWYSLHIELGERSPDATIILPRGGPYQRDRLVSSLYGLGRAHSVTQARFPFQFDELDAFLTTRGQTLLAEPRDQNLVSTGPGRTGFSNWLLVVDEPGTVSDRTLVAVALTLDGVEHLAFFEQSLLRPDLRREIDDA